LNRHGVSGTRRHILVKTRDLLRLAEMAAGRRQGVSLAEIAEAFDADHRTAQRMARALENTFPDVKIRTDPDRRRRWKLRDPGLARSQGIRDDEFAALGMSIRRAERETATPDAAGLAALRDRLRGDAGPASPPRRG
jgi:predicted DNA-binding transcriptional regulator YafY